MSTMRWLLHSARCWYWRTSWRSAADDYFAAERAVHDARKRMNRATAQEIAEAEAFARWRKGVREAAQ